MKLRRRHFEWIGIVFLALAALLYSQPEVSISGNESTRFAVIQAVGEQHVFHIEKTNFRTVDRVIRDNHVYSDKPLPIGWGLGMVHRVLHGVTGWNFFDNYNLLIYLFNLGFGGLINILLFVWSFRQFCRVRRGSVPLKFLLALGMCIGTWLFSYSVTVNNHTPAALAVLGLYVVLEKYRRRPSRRLAAAAGLTAGLVAAADLPVGAVFAVAAVAALWLLAPRRGTDFRGNRLHRLRPRGRRLATLAQLHRLRNGDAALCGRFRGDLPGGESRLELSDELPLRMSPRLSWIVQLSAVSSFRVAGGVFPVAGRAVFARGQGVSGRCGGGHALLPLFYRRIRRLGVWIPLSYAGDSDPVAHRRALAAGSAVPTSEVCGCRAAGRRGDRGGAGGSLLPPSASPTKGSIRRRGTSPATSAAPSWGTCSRGVSPPTRIRR
ncbi:MAG: hypothetical protein L6W00_13560 [Lentisphaeria bacterium]|nr:MAG: hypothetical protein L6W00_13560 [Lentisphaeria bacterium]